MTPDELNNLSGEALNEAEAMEAGYEVGNGEGPNWCYGLPDEDLMDYGPFDSAHAALTHMVEAHRKGNG